MNGLWLVTGVIAAGVILTEIFVSRARKRGTVGWLKVPMANWIGVTGAAITILAMFALFQILL